MKRLFPLMLLIIFSVSLRAQSNDSLSVKALKTRGLSLDELYTFDSLHPVSESPLLKSFKGIGIAPVKEAYKLNRLTVDSILAADSLNPNFWRVYGFRSVNLFRQAKLGPKMAMSLFLPWFLAVFILVFFTWVVKLYFIHTSLIDPEKPDNDTISSVEEPPEEEGKNEGEEAGQVQ